MQDKDRLTPLRCMEKRQDMDLVALDAINGNVVFMEHQLAGSKHPAWNAKLVLAQQLCFVA